MNRLMLIGLDVEVTSAMSAQEARAALGERTFDAIFSDIRMPEEDGYQFMKAVRTEGTSYARNGSRSRCCVRTRLRARTASASASNR